jgi:MarR family 2-MHQ and catechol resistance regulon transcriptional repressor
MLVTGGNMTLVLDNIEKLGYLERIQCKDDRRALIIQLTAAGKNLFEEIFKHHAEHIGKLMSVITPSEQKQLGELLKKLGLAVSKLS